MVDILFAFCGPMRVGERLTFRPPPGVEGTHWQRLADRWSRSGTSHTTTKKGIRRLNSTAITTSQLRRYAWNFCSRPPKSEADHRRPHSVRFFNLTDGSHRSERAAWAYEAPRASYAHVAHWIGFWNDVELQRFADPDRLDVRRPLNRHLAFGGDADMCLGITLARLEGRLSIRALTRSCQS
jgi:hypothetical protein